MFPILKKSREAYFATMFEDVRHDISLILLLSLTDPDNLKQSNFTNDEINVNKKLAFEKLQTKNIKRACRNGFNSKSIFRIVIEQISEFENR